MKYLWQAFSRPAAAISFVRLAIVSLKGTTCVSILVSICSYVIRCMSRWFSSIASSCVIGFKVDLSTLSEPFWGEMLLYVSNSLSREENGKCSCKLWRHELGYLYWKMLANGNSCCRFKGICLRKWVATGHICLFIWAVVGRCVYH